MPRLMNKRLILAKIEATYGADSVPTIANAVVCGDITLNGIEAEYAKRKIARPFLGSAGSVRTFTKSNAKFGVELAGSGAAGTAPAYSHLLRSCGLSETVTAATKVDYKPISEAFESVTQYGYEEGLLYKLLGARGGVDLMMSVGDIPVLAFDYQALYGGTPTLASTPTGTLPNYILPVAVGTAYSSLITINGATYVWQSCNIKLGNAVQHSNVVGGEEVLITDRNVVASVVLKPSAAEELALIQLVESGADITFAVQHGSVAGNIVSVANAASGARLTKPQRQELDGQMMLGFEIELNPSATGNDDITLTIK